MRQIYSIFLMKHSKGGGEIEFFPWSVLEFVLCQLDQMVVNELKVRQFGYVLANQFVQVLDAVLFPRAIRVAK